MPSFHTDPIAGLARLLKTEEPATAAYCARELVTVALRAIQIRDARSDEERAVAAEAMREQAAGLDGVLRG